MLSHIKVRDRQARIQTLLAMLNHADQADYIGEAVTQKTHALQCAYFAETLGHHQDVILASLLHDIGHFCYAHELPSMDHLGIIDHEWLGRVLP